MPFRINTCKYELETEGYLKEAKASMGKFDLETRLMLQGFSIPKYEYQKATHFDASKNSLNWGIVSAEVSITCYFQGSSCSSPDACKNSAKMDMVINIYEIMSIRFADLEKLSSVIENLIEKRSNVKEVTKSNFYRASSIIENFYIYNSIVRNSETIEFKYECEFDTLNELFLKVLDKSDFDTSLAHKFTKLLRMWIFSVQKISF